MLKDKELARILESEIMLDDDTPEELLEAIREAYNDEAVSHSGSSLGDVTKVQGVKGKNIFKIRFDPYDL